MGMENTAMGIHPYNLSVEYFTHVFTNNILIVPRSCDTLIPQYLEIELSSTIDREQFTNICHNICFEMTIGGATIVSIPLRFMLYLKEFEICDNKFYISIPFPMFCDEIKLIALQYHQVCFNLINFEGNLFSSCNLISKGIFYDTPARRSMAENGENGFESIIQCLSSTEIICQSPKNEFGYQIPSDGVHKGFFIECENVDNIKELKLIFNSNERTNYNRFLIRANCIKIHSQLLYFPFNCNKLYTDRTPQGFEGAANLSRIDVSRLNIKFDNIQSKICIYGLSSNILRTISGMSGLAFSHNIHNTARHVTCPYVMSGIYDRQRRPIPIRQSIDTIIYRPITNSDKFTCPITREDISANSRYMSCVQCHNNFCEEYLKQWFNSQNHRNTCPMCRANWTDRNIYINGEDISESESISPLHALPLVAS